MKINKTQEGEHPAERRTGIPKPKPISNLNDARKNARAPGSASAGKE